MRYRLLLACFVAGMMLVMGWSILASLSQPVRAQSTDMKARGESSSKLNHPAHYVVFKKETNGKLAPRSYRQVALAGALVSLEDVSLERQLSQEGRNDESLVVRLQAESGKIVYQNVVRIPRWLRGEFHGAEEEAPLVAQAGSSHPKGMISVAPIEGHLFPLDASFFVVRLPVIPNTTLLVQDRALKVLERYEMADLVTRTPKIDLKSMNLRSQTLQMSGNPRNRVDFLVMGDGYTTAEEAAFNADAGTSATEFFAISPYADYLNFVNIQMLFTPSSQSGADHPPYEAGCVAGDRDCCGDPTMKNDPLAGIIVDTAFNSQYCFFNIHRLLVPDAGRVFAAAAAMPDWDEILLLVNDSTYGGSGGSISTASMNASAVQIAQHEYGHAFVNLADEYETPFPGYPSCSDVDGPACEANVTDVVIREVIKWEPWIEPTIPIPTEPKSDPQFADVVGLFEGARYLSQDMYRSGQNCIMRSLGSPYCDLPSQAYVLKLYNGGWGEPNTGIRLIEPETTVPTTNTLSLNHPATQTFRADILQPIGAPPVDVEWHVDGVPVAGATDESYTYVTDLDTLGPVEITLRVTDNTDLIHPEMVPHAPHSVYTWTVDVRLVPATVTLVAEPTTLVAGGSQTSLITATVVDAEEHLAVHEPVTFTSLAGTLDPAVGVTDANGVVTSTFTAGTRVGKADIIALADMVSASIAIDLILGDPASIVLVAEPEAIIANGVSTSVLTATVLAANGTPFASEAVTLTTSLGTLSPFTGTTALDGTITTTLSVSTTPGVALITAWTDSTSGTLMVDFLPNSPPTITLTAEPMSLMADGTSTAVVSSTLAMTGGLPWEGQLITFTTSLGRLSSLIGETNVTGVATATLTSPLTTGEATLTVTTGTLTRTLEVLFIPSEKKFYLPIIQK